MLTVEGLASDLGLDLIAGRARADARVRWVHITELPDPTPWLSGGELLLTTGLQLTGAADQRAFAARLAEHGVAGLGFGTGLGHDAVPRALREAAERLHVPLFEVPYEMPFIAITERAFTQLVSEEYATLRRGTDVHRRLERILLEERGLDGIVSATAEAIERPVAVLDGRGAVQASAGPISDEERRQAAAAVAGAAEEPGPVALAGGGTALPVATPLGGRPQAWLVCPSGGDPGDFGRLILQQAVTVVALELMRQRAMRDTERRLAGDVLAEALTGRLAEEEIESRLRPFGIERRAAVVVFAVADPTAAEPALELSLSARAAPALVGIRERLLCAVLDARELEPEALVADLAAELAAAGHPGGAGVSAPAALTSVRKAFHEARLALEAAGAGNGDRPAVATRRDLGAFRLLLSVQDEEALRLYCESLLKPLEDGGGDYGRELLRSLEAFIEHNGHWERAARSIYCHRHTLRYRIRRVEELTGRDLGSARDRVELWLALRARELVR